MLNPHFGVKSFGQIPIIILIIIYYYLVGDFIPWKIWKSMGRIIPFLFWKIKVMFETTNQLWLGEPNLW